MVEIAALPSLPERQSSYDALAEQYARVTVARSSMLRATRELMAARALGHDTESLFQELEVLHAAEARETAALAELIEATR
jgi:hypothetical protein